MSTDSLAVSGTVRVLVRDAETGEVVDSRETTNVTCVGMHEYFVDNLDPDQSVDKSAIAIAIGDDDGTSPSSSDTALNNEVFRKAYTNSTDNGTDLVIDVLVDEGEFNNSTAREVGLVTDSASGQGDLLNHSLITPITKDSTETMTVEVTLTFEAQ